MKFRINRIAYGCGALLAALVLASCASTNANGLTSTEGVLRGMVYNADRVPVLDVSVHVVEKGKTTKTALSDLHGRYSLSEVPYGNVTLEFTKEGYEPLEWSFSFKSPTQIVYTSMINLDQLLNNAADSIQKRDWAAAASYLNRCQKLSPDNGIADYLEGEMLAAQGKSEEAAAQLEKLSAEKAPIFAVELALADIYQKGLDQPDKALIHLKRALTVQDDVDVENRIAGMEKKP